MLSGHMWNSIRQPPLRGSGTGPESWISGSSQSQYIAESFVLFSVYLSIAICGIQLVGGKSPSSQPGLFLAGLFISLSVLIFIFRRKNQGYPLRLLF